jgi:transcription elongation factor GreA
MAEAKKNILTPDGLKALEDELQELKVVRRKEIAQKIKEAREQGDLSENAEYDAAKDAQGLLEAKIAQLKDTIATCRVIDESQIDTSKVQMLNKVTIKNTKTGATMTYTLVSETEANFKEGKLSIHTPIAQALVGKKLGDKVMVKVPAGEMEFEIMDISL